MLRSLALTLALSVAATAQEGSPSRRLNALSFLHPEATQFTEFDLQAMRTHGLEDLWERPPYGLIRRLVVDEVGFDIAPLRRVRNIGVPIELEWGLTTRTVTTFECDPSFRVEGSGILESYWFELEKSRHAGLAFWLAKEGEFSFGGSRGRPGIVEDGYGVIATGPSARLMEVLDRTGPAGPPAELMTLCVGRGRALMQSAIRFDEDEAAMLVATLAPEWTHATGAEALGCRFSVLPEDPRVHILLRLRYGRPGERVEAAAASIRKNVAEALEVPAYAMYRPLLKSIRVDVSRQDLEVRAHLKNMKELGGLWMLGIARTFFVQVRGIMEPLEGAEMEEVIRDVEVREAPPAAGQGGGGR